jgi:cytoplasmic iron level regulating protein YaaA (DUF328/UPF0246 family)
MIGGIYVVKLFHDRRHDELALLVQAWLDENTALRIVGMSSSSASYGHTVTLIFEPAEAPPRYQFSAFFCGVAFTGLQFEAVEEEAQQWVADGLRLVQVAQSQNDVGLFLALLAEAGQ